VLLAVTVLRAQTPVTGIFFDEGWESGSLTRSFNSQNFGSVSSSSEFRLDGVNTGTGAWSLRHAFIAGTPVGGIDTATQHFGDATSGPVWPTGSGQHFQDLYVQYRFYYSPGFDFGTGHYKQFMIGTQDNRRHDESCCLPFAAHYITLLVERGAVLQAEGYNKQATTGQRFDINPNTGGYSDSQPFVVQTGRWYTLQVRRRLNDAGVDNGIFQMWMDGVLIADYRAVRYRVPPNGSFGSDFTYGTNFAHIADYSTTTVSRNQEIYYDDVRLSTTFIATGPVTTPPAPPTNVRVIR
jgi:hypothetical protein